MSAFFGKPSFRYYLNLSSLHFKNIEALKVIVTAIFVLM